MLFISVLKRWKLAPGRPNGECLVNPRDFSLGQSQVSGPRVFSRMLWL